MRLHLELGARMVPFAGYAMPVQYPAGLMAEHHHTRNSAGLFDVSHMGQLRLVGPDAAAAFETLMPVDVIGLAPGKQRYGLLLTDEGGIIDDLMFVQPRRRPVRHRQRRLQGGRHRPYAGTHRPPLRGRRRCPSGRCSRCRARRPSTRWRAWSPASSKLVFMTGGAFALERRRPASSPAAATPARTASRSRCTRPQAEALARALLAQPEVKPVGLGARNSLRLEAGLCLYGNDIDTTTTPVEAGLTWAIQKVRRTGGAREGGFPGADKVLGQLARHAARSSASASAWSRWSACRCASTPNCRTSQGTRIGEVTSGLLGPTHRQAGRHGAMSPPRIAAPGTRV